MARTKIQDEQEARRWFEEGRSYPWMREQYLRKYNIETTNSMWGNLRRKWGYDLRIQHDEELIPWKVEREHRWAYPLAMLRAEGRRRRGEPLREQDAKKLPPFLEKLKDGDLVVHYDPRTEEGFFLVPRRKGIDTDLIRKPERRTGVKWGVEEDAYPAP